MIYIASPYSSPIIGVAESRYQRVCDFIDLMIAQGFVAFSPIAYCHPIAKRIGHATDHATWHHFNMGILRKAEALYALELPGHKESKGMQVELRVCHMLGIPVARYSADFALLSTEYRGSLVEQF